MSTPCNIQYQAVGPYSQTIFLGCSVVSFSMNLGWGGESSSCSVKLAKDYSVHHKAAVLDNIKNVRATVKALDGKQNTTTANAFNAQSLDARDNTYGLTRNIIEKEKEKYDNIQYNDIDTLTPVRIKDEGKKCWPTYLSDPTPLNWLSSDPGFLGNKADYNGNLDLDIIGCPVFFRFTDVWFGGMIKNWKYGNGEYDVELQSFAPLLKGCVLILQNYAGTISTVINGTSDALFNGQPLAVPYGDITVNIFNGSIFQGNIPNVFNVFGFLEAKGFGYSGFVPDKGISAGLIYDAIVSLLASNPRNQNQFNPFGAIVARTPLDRTNGNLLDPFATTYEPTVGQGGGELKFADMGLIKAVTAVDTLPRSLLRLDLSAVPRPPDEAYISSDTMDLISFIDYCCTNAGLDYYVDFEPDLTASPYSGTIKIRTITRRIQYKPNTIKNFLLNFTPNDYVVDYSFGEEYNDTKTRSILIGGPQERLHQFTTHTYSTYRHLKIFDPVLGTFVSMNNNIQTAQQIAGGNLFNTYRQPDHHNQRPLQGIKWKAVIQGGVVAQNSQDFWSSIQQSSYGALTINRGSYLDTLKPSLNSSQAAIPGESYPLYLDIISPYFGKSNNGVVRKTYLDKKTRQLQIVVDFRDIQAFFPTAYDINDGTWTSSYSQYIAQYYPGQVTQRGWAGIPAGGAVGYGNFLITEQELRHAIGDRGENPYERWWQYTKERAQYGYPTSIGRILYDYFARAYNEDFAKAVFFLGLDWNKNISYRDYLQLILYSIPGGVTSKLNQNALFSNVAMERWSFLNSGIESLLKSIHGFIKNMGDNHYGVTYAVRLPKIFSYTDYSGKTRYNYEICDSAWEEEGNTIDDTTEIGSVVSTQFRDDAGKISPILGFDNTAEYFNFYRPTNIESVLGKWSGAEVRNSWIQSQLDGFYGSNNWYLPIEHNLPPDSYWMVPYTTYIGSVTPPGGRIAYSPFANTNTAFGFQPPNGSRWKFYIKADTVNTNPDDETNPKIIYADGTPRVILRSPSPLRLKSESNLISMYYEELLPYDLFGDEDPPGMSPVYSNFGGNAAPDNVLANVRGTSNAFVIRNFLLTAAYSSTHPNMMDDNQYNNISKRAPLPVFAAVPIRNNLMTYGPWVSHPGIISTIVFPGHTQQQTVALVNNLAGGVECQIDRELVPWNYGGMKALDEAALLKVTENNNFQQVLEYGSLTLAGIMLNNARLGSTLITGSLGPIVTSLNVSLGTSGGITTRYELRTFSRKLGFFNKEQADNIQKLNREILKTNQKIADSIKSVTLRAFSFSKGQ